MTEILNPLVSSDEALFRWINTDLANPFFDTLMPWITNLEKSPSGLAFLGLILAFLVWRIGYRLLVGFVFAGIAVGLADATSHYLIKQYFQRARPSGLADAIVRTFPHVGFSFPSNHAANNMAIAVVLGFMVPRWRPWFLMWALLIGLSRIYVGVHYPMDVLGGFLVGGTWATLVVWMMKRIKSTAGFFPVQN
jgi:membrane-associated phospholipid phosphatase